MAEYIWADLLAEHGTTEAAWSWVRENTCWKDVLVGPDQQLLDVLWRDGLVKPSYSEPITLDTDLT
ncbi:hypothetical protein ACRYGU_16385 [Mycobacteroides abscessus]